MCLCHLQLHILPGELLWDHENHRITLFQWLVCGLKQEETERQGHSAVKTAALPELHVTFDSTRATELSAPPVTRLTSTDVVFMLQGGPQRNRSLVEAAYPDRSQHLFTLAALAACQVAQVFNMAITNKMTDSVEKTSSGRQVSGGGDLAE